MSCTGLTFRLTRPLDRGSLFHLFARLSGRVFFKLSPAYTNLNRCDWLTCALRSGEGNRRGRLVAKPASGQEASSSNNLLPSTTTRCSSQGQAPSPTADTAHLLPNLSHRHPGVYPAPVIPKPSPKSKIQFDEVIEPMVRKPVSKGANRFFNFNS